MTDPDRLPRSYQRLLRAYPRWYRRERGVELLTTLLDAAAPGQRRPARHDIVDLVGGGLRCRLRLPRGIGYRLVAVVVALFAGLAGLAVVELQSAPGAPTEAQAMAAAAAAVPVRPDHVAGPAAPCAWCPNWDDGPLDRRDFVAVAYKPPPGQVPALVTHAHAGLAAAGWRVDPEVTEDEDSGTLHFRADRDGTTVSLTGVPAGVFLDKDPSRPDPDFVSVTLVVTRSFSAVAVVTMATGLLGGLLTGWLATAWILQCFRRRRPAIRVAMLLTGLPAVLVAVLWELDAAQWLIALIFFANWSPNYLWLPAFLATNWPQPTAIATVAALMTAGFAALPSRDGTHEQPPTPRLYC